MEQQSVMAVSNTIYILGINIVQCGFCGLHKYKGQVYIIYVEGICMTSSLITHVGKHEEVE